jgi:RNA polymerase sigma-70 factor (ECF subfamily)
MDDVGRQLVARARQGDYSAFEELVKRYERRIYSFALRVLRRHHDAENVVQDTFTAVVEHLPDFREEARFSTWLMRIAANAAFKILRKKRGLPLVPLADADDDYATVPHPEYIADWRDNPEQLATRAETQRLLDAALDDLEEKYRLVFLLRDVQGLSTAETAEALGLSESAVKVRLLRARLLLRERLTQQFGDPNRRLIPDHRHEE